LYLIYMSTGAYNIARSYVDKYIVIWTVVINVMNSCCWMILAVSFQCTVSL
jgi:hypothetical protein